MTDTPLSEGKQPLSNSIFIQMQIDILSGVIKPGEKLTEQAVCKQYNVSRTPVREAFRQLESDGLIENVPNRGAYVIGLSRRDVSDLFDLRRLFEAQAVEWSVERVTEEEIDTLRENLDFMKFYTLKGDVDKVLQFNSTFHNNIYRGTRNRMLVRTLSSYQIYLKHSAPAKTISQDYLDTILEEHTAIFEAFESRNPAAGHKAMEYHMTQSKLRRFSTYF